MRRTYMDTPTNDSPVGTERSVKIFLAVAVVIIIGAFGYVFAFHRSDREATVGDAAVSVTPTVAPTYSSTPRPSLVGMKLADTPFADTTYLISTKTLSAAAKQALVGFAVTSTKGTDGTTTYILKATNPEYEDQTYTLKPGEQLCFVELSLGDDAGGTEANPRDDHAFVVDATGTIIR